MSANLTNRTTMVRDLALRHGFMSAGIAKAERMEEEASRLEEWLGKDYHGKMSYMANHFEMRIDPTKLVPGAKSVISLQYNYFPQRDLVPPSKGDRGLPGTQENLPPSERVRGLPGTQENLPPSERVRGLPGTQENLPPSERVSGLPGTQENLPPSEEVEGFRENDARQDNSELTSHSSPTTPFKISRYAYGEDYHKVVRRKLKAMVRDLKESIGDFNARVFVDSAPVMERDWAQRSGQGWVGKNTLLIHPKEGSYFFLAEIILDVELAYDHPIKDHCGTCTKCIDACPTEAIAANGYVLDGSKCISYLTIELKNEIPESFKGQMENWIFGCDICQEVCPWNRFSKPHNEPAFLPSEQLSNMTFSEWNELKEEVFDELFAKSPVKRAGYEGLMRNINFLSSADQ